MEKRKLTDFERKVAGGILQAFVAEQGIVLDLETNKPLGFCEAPKFRQEEDCIIIDLNVQPFKPLNYIECDVVVDRSK